MLELVEALGRPDNDLRRTNAQIGASTASRVTFTEGFRLVFFARCGVNEWDGAGPHVEDYNKAKRDLIFCRLAQDGTGQGIFFLDRMPTPDEAALIRDTLVIAKKREMGEPSEAQMAARAAFAAEQKARKREQGATATGKSQPPEIRPNGRLSLRPASLTGPITSNYHT